MADRCNLGAVAGKRSPSLELADATRRGDQKAAPFELWQEANEEAPDAPERRRALYRYAMVHAGHLVTKAGSPYRRCPVCREALGR